MTVKEGRLLGRWSKREGDFLFTYPNKPDGHYLHFVFSHLRDEGSGRSIVEELEARGYDITTLRFQVDRAPK